MQFLLTICFLLASPILWAHGVHGTGAGRQYQKPDTDFWSIFIPSTEAAITHMDIDEKLGLRIIDSDGLPNHKTGAFPNAHNPNHIEEQYYQFKVPLHPQKAAHTTPLNHADFGVALNGVPFDPESAEFWNGNRDWNEEAMSPDVNLGLDSNNAHVQPTGAYHYHGMPIGFVDKYNYRSTPVMIGYAADGFPIYTPYAQDVNGQKKTLRSSYRLKTGQRPSPPNGPGGTYNGLYSNDYEFVSGAGDLDQCNGRTAVTADFPQGIYYYVITQDFPFIPRCWVGTADASFRKGPPTGNRRGIGPQGPGMNGPMGMRPPPPRRF
ncbi:MAG: hypothetical protein COV45_09350 [Deltaproteobacteria bacterium CG11_big_fil_rev_8_21_14_0_20_47_16]|nr:MAG: hypothetical protein COV45_09350 [Deltaproteobacteria bacterium CG11_big_fil_rev_8_21_14_0_20_47_16]